MAEAEEKTGVSSKNIWNAIHKKVKTAGNFQWAFEKDKEKPKKLEKVQIYNQKVSQYNPLTNEKIATFKSASEASRITGIFDITIRRCCKGLQKTSGNFVWKYEGDD